MLPLSETNLSSTDHPPFGQYNAMAALDVFKKQIAIGKTAVRVKPTTSYGVVVVSVRSDTVPYNVCLRCVQ